MATITSERVRARRAPRWRGMWVTVAAAALLAGCGGSSQPGIAHLSSSTTGAAQSPGQPPSGGRSPVAFAACMRSHGVPGFPDPDRSGRIGTGSGVDPSSPQFQAAAKTCQSLRPAGGTFSTQGSGAVSPQRQTELLRFARCMRSHGVPSFPDPTSRGIALSSAVDPSSPQFQSAQQACKSLLPGLGQGQVTVKPGSGGTS
jgi:hypothetical protein